MILEKIEKPNDIKKIAPIEYNELASEIRSFLIENISKTGGHLASNLGVVELTMALHLVFNLPKDKLIWDVGHQAYTHKILTGRKEFFSNLRKYGGMSGFPKRNESRFDAFDTGHSSTSISAGLGYVCARDLKKEHYSVISVIGDGALTGGMAYEALNNASRLDTNFIIVLNDNKMSIARNVGGISEMLSNIRSSSSYINLKDSVVNKLYRLPHGDGIVDSIKHTKSNIKRVLMPDDIFENMGLYYLGPFDGHDINKMIQVFSTAKKIHGPVVVHIVTEKGHGYKPAVRNPSKFHGIGPFDIASGEVLAKSDKATYSEIFSQAITSLAKEDEKICAITAAMPDGTGLTKFARWFPDRFFDVGIAEAHAVTFAAGLAAGGMTPVFAVYSSFLQRAYDQILHDVCIQNLHVVLCIDRAGLVGSDGETHQGIFDLSFLSHIPNMSIFAPKNGQELKKALYFATQVYNGPIAIRYPRGIAIDSYDDFDSKIEYGKSEVMYEEKDIALMAVGSMVTAADHVRNKLKEKGLNVSLINARFVKPYDKEAIDNLTKNHKLLVTLEENVLAGGFGEAVTDYVELNSLDIDVLNIALPDDYIEHGNVTILKSLAGIDSDTITQKILKAWEGVCNE